MWNLWSIGSKTPAGATLMDPETWIYIEDLILFYPNIRNYSYRASRSMTERKRRLRRMLACGSPKHVVKSEEEKGGNVNFNLLPSRSPR